MTAPSPQPARPAGGKGMQILFFIAGVLVVLAAVWIIQKVRKPAAPATASMPAETATMPAQNTPVPQEAVPSADEEAQIKAMPRISVADAKAALDSGKATLIDVRDAEDYLAMHAAGALHIPVRYIAGEAQYLPRDKTIIFYCT